MQFLLVVVSLLSVVNAFPNGTVPACVVGSASVLGLHLDETRDPTSGSNERGGYGVFLNGMPLVRDILDPIGSANLFQPGVEHTLVIQSFRDAYIKGFLVTASGGNPDNVDSLDTRTPQALTITNAISTQPSVGCEGYNVASIVHTEPS
jgi:hypothetical protein